MSGTVTAIHRIRQLNARDGDAGLHWDPSDEESVGHARRMFDDLKASGYTAFRMTDGKQGEQISAFDPATGEIIMVPRMAGG